jgi:cobalt/nickel transport system permease protein
MHIPDGLLSTPVSLVCAGLSVVAVGAATARSRFASESRHVALMGMAAAFVFAAQLLNFPVAGGTSGHLIGGVLAAVLLGPAAAVVAMTAVLILQCLVFGDGGLMALGANVLNMAVIQPLVGITIYAVVSGRAGAGRVHPVRRVAAAAFASWIATIVAAAACAGELALSRVVTPGLVLPAMLAVHAAIGLGEGLITALVLSTILRLRPELLARRVGREPAAGRAVSFALLGLVASLALALFVSPFACTWPDGLERVAERLGLEPASVRLPFDAPLRSYALPSVPRSPWTLSMAAAIGTLLAFAICVVLGVLLAPRAPANRPPPARDRS